MYTNIEKNSSPPPTVSQLLAKAWPADYGQVANRLTADGTITKIKNTNFIWKTILFLDKLSLHAFLPSNSM